MGNVLFGAPAKAYSSAFDLSTLPWHHYWEAEDLGADGATISSWTDRAGNSNLVTGSGTVTVSTTSPTAVGKSARFGGSAYLQCTNHLMTAVQALTASSTLDGSRVANQAADGFSSQWGWASAAAPSVGTPVTLQSDFTTPFVATSVQIALFAEASRGPKDFKIQGWNGSTWDDLLTVTGETTWTASGAKSWSITNSTSYSRYRLNCTATQGADIIYLEEIRYNSVSNVQPAELWMVVKTDGAGGFPVRAASGQDTRYTFSGDIYADWQTRGSRAIWTPSMAVTSWRLLRAQGNGTTVKYWLDKHLEFTHNTSVTPASLTPLLLGQGGTGFVGNVAACGILPLQSDATADQMAAAFATKHGLSIP